MYGFSCEHCDGTVRERRVDREALRHKEGFVILEDVPIGVCDKCGARYFELKTVQKLDALQIEKPCILALDEGYNTEWSTELSLEQAFDEYLKAWLILPVLEETFGLACSERRSFAFNMSVGYDLEGIRSERMDRFISSLMDASLRPEYGRYVEGIDA